ncbi:MAG: hypothetical protein AMK69_20915 [Nitrospira bacterium SG8_3]|nr:MAG: hypothetical protein AMK69_20915 [Nitrospira bacterium SG8_3]
MFLNRVKEQLICQTGQVLQTSTTHCNDTFLLKSRLNLPGWKEEVCRIFLQAVKKFPAGVTISPK